MTPNNSHDWSVIESRTEYETGWYDGGYDLVTQPDGTEKRYYWADLPPAVVVIARIGPAIAIASTDGVESPGLSEPTGVSKSAGEGESNGGPGLNASSNSTSGEDRLLFVEQYRPTIRETHLELPAGIVEDDESYTEAGARELEEETGFRPTSTALLQEYSVATGVLNHDRGVVYAEGLEPVERELDSNEFLTVKTVPVSEAIDRAREPPTNGSTVSGLLLAKEEGLLFQS